MGSTVDKHIKGIIVAMLIVGLVLAIRAGYRHDIERLQELYMDIIHSEQEGQIIVNVKVLQLLRNDENDEAIKLLEGVTRSTLKHYEGTSDTGEKLARSYEQQFCREACLSRIIENEAP